MTKSRSNPAIILEEIAARAITHSGIPSLLRNILANKATIIFYHDPKPDVLDRHLDYLSHRYNFISLSSLVEAIYSRDWSAIPERSLVLTLDDGHKGNFYLLNVFKKYKITPTIYLSSAITNTSRQYWFTLPNRKTERIIRRYEHRKRLTFLEKRYGFKPTKQYQDHERQTLNSKEIASMKAFVDFQSHSRFHPILTTCSFNECESEILHSKAEVESLVGNECLHFSYPNGVYSDREVELVKKAGYLSARTVDIGWNDVKSDPYKLKAISISDDGSIDLLQAQLTGIIGYIRKLVNFIYFLVPHQV